MAAHTYKQAGVDLDASQDVKRRIGEIASGTHGPEVLAGVGAFGALYSLSGYRDLVLVSSTDGVGTKLKIASAMNSYDGLGVDLVNACVNDVIVCGARPLFFLDYLAMGPPLPRHSHAGVEGMARACREAGCALVGGETAELPGVYSGRDFDMAGFAVGAVERSEMLDGSGIEAGDLLVGLPSNGLHTNGYSLVRHALGLDDDPSPLYERHPELGRTLGEALLTPHASYYRALAPLFPLVKGMAHITGGGLIENVPRMLPEGLAAGFTAGSWPLPPIFSVLQERSEIETDEMYRVFNMGLGMVLACSPDRARDVLERAPDALIVGEVTASAGGPRVIL